MKQHFKKGKKITLCLLYVLAFLTISLSVASAAPARISRENDLSFGGIKLFATCDNPASYSEVLGDVVSIEKLPFRSANPGGTFIKYAKGTITLSKNNDIVAMTCNSIGVKTPRGIGVEYTLTQVLNVYGMPDVSSSYGGKTVTSYICDKYLFIRFDSDSNGIVNSIMIAESV